MAVPKVRYITNKDFLREIHRSKNTYCSYTREEYGNYDAIVQEITDITPALIEQTQAKRAAQMMSVDRAKQKTAGIKPYAMSVAVVDPQSILTNTLVFRVMTYDHVPLDPARKRKPRNMDHSYAKTNFPPFKHYIIDNGELLEVGRSHWQGSFSNGYFDAECGRMSTELAAMFMLLVERYSRRGNFRNYSYIADLRSNALLQLAQIGLQFDESKSANPFAFFTTAVRNAFVRVLNIEKKCQSLRDDLLFSMGASTSYTRQTDDALRQRE